MHFLANVIPLLEFVVREGALVGVALGDDGELVAPLELPHVRRLRPPFHLALGNLKEEEKRRQFNFGEKIQLSLDNMNVRPE